MIIILVSIGIFLFFIYFSGVNSNYRASFAGMMTGDAHRPFVTRVLIPWLTRGIAVLLPDSVGQAAETLLVNSGPVGNLLTEYMTPAGFGLEAIISLLLQFISVVGFAFTFRELFHRVFIVQPVVSQLMTVAALLGLTPMLFFGYIYDLPNLFLTTLALSCIVAQRKRLYWAVFTLAIFNKETAIMLLVPGLLLYWDLLRPSLRNVVTGVVAQVVLFLAIRLPIGWLYRNNAGSGFEYHLQDNIGMFIDFPTLGIISVALAAGMLVLIFGGWRKKPAAALLGALPGLLLLVLYIVSGIAFEIRIFYEVYAAGFLCLIYTLTARKIPLESRLPDMQQWIDSLPALLGRQGKVSRE